MIHIDMHTAAIGEGVNADNIAAVIQLLKKKNFDGVVSIECQGTRRCIKNSVQWLRQQIGK